MAVEAGWLSFWRAKAAAKVDPATIHDALQRGDEPAELEDVPVDEILAALKHQYPSFDPGAEFVEIDLPSEETAIEPHWNRKHFHFTFYGDAFRQMDRVTELMTARFGLACYDAGTRTMYSADSPPPSFLGTPEDQAFSDAFEKTLMKGAADARASSSDPKERLKQLQAFIDSGAAQAALEKELNRPPAKKKRKK